MNNLPYVVLALACPVGMGAMMWFMMRGGHSQSGTPETKAMTPGQQAELDQLRAELVDLKREGAPRRATPPR